MMLKEYKCLIARRDNYEMQTIWNGVTVFLLVSVVVLVASYFGKLPKGMVGAYPLIIILGVILNLIGDRMPIVKTYLGGGAIVCIFASAWMAWAKLFRLPLLRL